MSKKYILNEQGEPVLEEDILKWAKWYETADEKRCVARDEVGGIVVSTVFLGLDHNHRADGPPLLFETMVYDKATREFMDGQRRYTTRDEARSAHEDLVTAMRVQAGRTIEAPAEGGTV